MYEKGISPTYVRLADRIAHGKLVPVVWAMDAQFTAAPLELVQLAEASTVTAEGVVMCGASTFPPLAELRLKVWPLYDTVTGLSVVSKKDEDGSQPYLAMNA